MASLYIKDAETAQAVARVARKLGKTKTQVVREAIANVEAEMTKESTKSTLEWLEEYRRKHPLPPPTGLKADKAFFDEMWGEDPD